MFIFEQFAHFGIIFAYVLTSAAFADRMEPKPVEERATSIHQKINLWLNLFTTMNRHSRIRNAEQYLAPVPNGEPFHVVCEVTNESDERLRKIGFRDLKDGECVLPRELGSATRRNSNGYDIIFKNKPKELFIISFMAPGWHDTYHPVHIERWRYPRKHIAGYELELTLMVKEGKRYVVSPELIHLTSEADKNKHALNLFLELFGRFDFLNKDMEAIFREMKMVSVNWTLLPIGEYPFSRLEKEGYLSKGQIKKKEYRHTDEVIRSYHPAQCVVGNGGFRGYIAFVFPDRNLTLLEHFEKGNATYVFDLDWAELSKKTKAEILNQNLEIARIIHTDNWEWKVRELFSNHPIR